MQIIIGLFLVIGGGLGALARFGLDTYLTRIFDKLFSRPFPLGIIVVNIIAAFIMGFVTFTLPSGFFVKEFMTVGFLGGFSTFSTAMWDTVQLRGKSRYMASWFYLFMQIVVTILAAALGVYTVLLLHI